MPLNLFSNLKLTYKLSVVILLSVVISIVFYGGYSFYYLKKSFAEQTQKKVEHALSRIDSDVQTIIKSVSTGAEFIEQDELILASLSLVNYYENKENYSESFIDEEKKSLLEELLYGLKLSENSEIALYNKDQELLAFILKDSSDYVMNYISYEDGKKKFNQKFETQSEYSVKEFIEHPIVRYKHKPYYDVNSSIHKPIVTFHLLNDELIITAHQDILDELTKKIMGHIEVSAVLSQEYFLNVSKDLNVHVYLSTDPKYEASAVSLFEPFKTKNFMLLSLDESLVTSISFPMQDKVLYMVFDFDKYDATSSLTQNRANLFLFLLVLFITLPSLVAYIFKNWLVKPMKHLMVQIDKIEKGDYSKTEIIHTNDELEMISRNINKLAISLNRREKQLKLSEEKYEHLSNHDPLTNLPNRRLFYYTLDHAIELAKRSNTKVAVIFLDLDQFKHINDTMGHHIGDELLVEVAQRLQKIIRRSDSVARVGGDEFNILLENVKELYDVELIAQKLLESFEKPFQCSLGEINTALSIGISIFPDDSKEPNELIKYADLAMYKTKDAGRNNYSFFSKELSLIMQERTSIIDALKQALKSENEFQLLYQPKISSATGRIVSVEALIRWHSKSLGFVTPDRFIKLAEETNLIIPIGRWVLEKACQDYLHLLETNHSLESISVNVSAVQLKNSDMVQTLQEVLQKSNMQPSMLELEITESYISANEHSAIAILQKFRDMGIALAIDDFGTGYSSLSYLHKLPVTKLKVDKSFVDEIETQGSGIAIVKAIIVLAKTFALQITAEGVETKAQLDFLKEHGCDEIQGYYYSKPLPLEELKNFF